MIKNKNKKCIHFHADSQMQELLDACANTGISKQKMIHAALKIGRSYDPSITVDDGIIRRVWVDYDLHTAHRKESEILELSQQAYYSNIIKKFLLCEGKQLLDAFAPFV